MEEVIFQTTNRRLIDGMVAALPTRHVLSEAGWVNPTGGRMAYNTMIGIDLAKNRDKPRAYSPQRDADAAMDVFHALGTPTNSARSRRQFSVNIRLRHLPLLQRKRCTFKVIVSVRPCQGRSASRRS